MIFFVDEDVSQTWAFRSELEVRGHVVRPLSSADEAWAELANNQAVTLAIIDIMLSVHDPTSERFSRRRTDAYYETGLVLLEDLSEENPTVFPERAVFLTNTTTERTLRAAREWERKRAVPILRKSEFGSPLDFGDRIDEILANLDRPSAG